MKHYIGMLVRRAAKRHRLICRAKELLSRKLVVELRHGLANRMCTYVSASVGARATARKLSVRWIRNPLCNCSFGDLFENEINEGGIVLDFDDDMSGQAEYLADFKTMFYEDSKFKLFRKADDVYAGYHDIPYFTGTIDDGAILFSKELNTLRYVKCIRDKKMSLPPGTIGVHIRTHDLPSWQPEHLDWYFSRIDAHLANHPKGSCFLATDCDLVRKEFRIRYGAGVLSYQCTLFTSEGELNRARNTVEGVQDALLDLITLAESERILKTPGSSFGWLASMWGLIPFEIPPSKIRQA